MAKKRVKPQPMVTINIIARQANIISSEVKLIKYKEDIPVFIFLSVLSQSSRSSANFLCRLADMRL